MEAIFRTLERILRAVSDSSSAGFLNAILEAPRVFVYGLGRSGLVARMFGMRLVHLGRDATVVGDTTTPAIRERDLLVLCSRTCKSPFLHHVVRLAGQQGSRTALVTGGESTTLEQGVDLVVRLPLETATDDHDQPMGSLFEQALLLYLDGVVLRLMAELSKTPEDMERIHSNLP